MNKRNTVSGILVFLFFAFFYLQSGALKQAARYWPQLIAEIGMVLTALNVAFSAVQWRKEKDSAAVFPLNKEQLLRSVLLAAAAAIWIFLIPRLGYLVSAIAATLAIVLLFEPSRDKRHIVIDVIATFAFTFVMYKLFSMLGVRFPQGILL